MVTLAGDADSAKFPTGFTLNVTDAVCAMLPEVPMIVTLVVPTGAVAIAVSVIVVVPVAGFGLNVAVTPVGSCAAE